MKTAERVEMFDAHFPKKVGKSLVCGCGMEFLSVKGGVAKSTQWAEHMRAVEDDVLAREHRRVPMGESLSWLDKALTATGGRGLFEGQSILMPQSDDDDDGLELVGNDPVRVFTVEPRPLYAVVVDESDSGKTLGPLLIFGWFHLEGSHEVEPAVLERHVGVCSLTRAMSGLESMQTPAYYVFPTVGEAGQFIESLGGAQ